MCVNQKEKQKTKNKWMKEDEQRKRIKFISSGFCKNLWFDDKLNDRKLFQRINKLQTGPGEDIKLKCIDICI